MDNISRTRADKISSGISQRVTKALADKMGTRVNTSDRLQRTYMPVDLVNVRRADEARLIGRKAIAAKSKK